MAIASGKTCCCAAFFRSSHPVPTARHRTIQITAADTGYLEKRRVFDWMLGRRAEEVSKAFARAGSGSTDWRASLIVATLGESPTSSRWLAGLPGWGYPAQFRVWPDLVVMVPPGIEHEAGMWQRLAPSSCTDRPATKCRSDRDAEPRPSHWAGAQAGPFHLS